MDGEQTAQGNRERQHPLAHRYLRDDMVHQMGRCLGHAARAAGGADAAALRREGSPLGGQEKATRFSSLQPSQRNRIKPWARIPQAKIASNSSVSNVGWPDPPAMSPNSRFSEVSAKSLAASALPPGNSSDWGQKRVKPRPTRPTRNST